MLVFMQSLNVFAKSWNYDVIRKGKNIGTHSYTFTENGNNLKVDVLTDIKVKIGFIPVYRFKTQGTEEWDEGKLTAYKSTSDDNGEDKYLIINNNYLESNLKKESFISSNYVPASLWSFSTVTQSELLNTLDGSLMKVSITKLGDEEISSIVTTKYEIAGEFKRSLWFDKNNKLIQVKFSGDDGSEILYRLR